MIYSRQCPNGDGSSSLFYTVNNCSTSITNQPTKMPRTEIAKQPAAAAWKVVMCLRMQSMKVMWTTTSNAVPRTMSQCQLSWFLLVSQSNEPQCITCGEKKSVRCRYNVVKFPQKYPQKTPHSSPVRARYGVSFVDRESSWHSASAPGWCVQYHMIRYDTTRHDTIRYDAILYAMIIIMIITIIKIIIMIMIRIIIMITIMMIMIILIILIIIIAYLYSANFICVSRPNAQKRFIVFVHHGLVTELHIQTIKMLCATCKF